MVRSLQIGLTTRCHSNCSLCMRRILASKGFKDFESDIQFEAIERVIETSGINEIQLCGNRGEALHYPLINEVIDLIKKNEKVLTINTNGDKFDYNWWFKLGKKMNRPRDRIIFALDGIGKVHTKYRNTNFKNVFNNMTAFIKGGGSAIWQMVLFKHNEHQIDFVKKIAKSIGCVEVWIINSRYYNKENERPLTVYNKTKQEIMLESEKIKIQCRFDYGERAYLAVNGELWPCCHIRCCYGFRELIADQNNKFTKTAEDEKSFINILNTPINEIAEKSTLFKMTFNNMEKEYTCRKFCGNRDILDIYNRRRIIN